MCAYVWGYVIPLVATPVVWLAWILLHKSVQRLRVEDEKISDRTTWLPLTMGIVERLIYATLVGFEVSRPASFIGSWVTIKAIGGWAAWARENASKYARSVFIVGLLCSGISAIFGIAGGLIIASERLQARQPHPW